MRVLCDGDAKTTGSLNANKVYGDKEISKVDCINHVSKRLYKGIETAKVSSKGTEHHLSGKGRVTKKLQKQLSVSYTQALKDNAPNVDKMQQAVMATLYHRMSTDDQPMHQFCPDGLSSWCRYKQESAQNLPDGSRTYKHKCVLKPQYGKQLIPVYKRLSDKKLLERCIDMKTTNSNECFNGLIWRRVPKHLTTSVQILQIGVSLSVLQFNTGSKGIESVFDHLGLSPGYHHRCYSDTATKVRRKLATKYTSKDTKKQRISKKLINAGLADKYQDKEGTLYEAGGFND